MTSKHRPPAAAATLLLLPLLLLLVLLAALGPSPILAQSDSGSNGRSQGTRAVPTPARRQRLAGDARRAALAASSPPAPPAPRREWAAVESGKEAGADASPQQQRLEQQLVGLKLEV